METKFVILFLLNIYNGLALKCFTCNSESHPGICDYHGNLTKDHVNHTVECQGTCKIGSLRSKTNEVHLRMCESKNKQNGCDVRSIGVICQCSFDFCNKDLETCHKISRCKQPLHPKAVKMTKHSDSNKLASTEEEFHEINRSITIFGTVIGCLVGLVLLILIVVIVFKSGKRRHRGRVFQPLKATWSFHSAASVRTPKSSVTAPPPTYQDVVNGENVVDIEDTS